MNSIGTTIIILFILCLIIAVAVSRGKYTERENREAFLERESRANSVRRADISSLDYIRVPLDALPLDAVRRAGYGELCDKLTQLAENRILNLSRYTNTELKLMYGPANLDDLCRYDNNYTELIRLLDKLSECMLEAGDAGHARLFLEYAVSVGSDISKTYVRLAGLYADEKNTALLDALIQKAQNLPGLSGPVIINKINSIKSNLK